MNPEQLIAPALHGAFQHVTMEPSKAVAAHKIALKRVLRIQPVLTSRILTSIALTFPLNLAPLLRYKSVFQRCRLRI
jgi:hypothetical protein